MTFNRLLFCIAAGLAVTALAAMVFIALAPYLIGGCIVWLLWRTVVRTVLFDKPATDANITIVAKEPARGS